jgi:predicted phosphate transport protein (TIGR00153 family)
VSLIGNLFGRSPVRPMQEHMNAAVACVRVVQPLVEAMVAGDHAAVARHRATIDDLEHEADDIKNDIRSHMPRRFMMAMERRDMLEILDCQDSIADTAQDIAELAELRGMQVPAPMAEPLLTLVRSVIAACEQGQRVISQLDELVETGFGAREVARVEEMIGELNRVESETDEHARTVLSVLFSMEDELGVGTYFWYRIVIWTADLADYAERVGNRIRLLIAQ